MAWYDDIRDTASSAGSSVLEGLGWLDKPQNALQVALYELAHGKGPTLDRTWEGLKSGWGHEVDRTWTDTLGLDRPASDQDWPEWIARGVAHYGPDFFLDPVFFAGKLGKGARGLKAYQAASEAVHGSGIGRALLPGMPAHLRDLELPFLKAEREGAQALDPAREGFLATKAAEKAAGIKGEEALLGARQSYERPFQSGNLAPDVLSGYEKQRDIASGMLDEYNQYRISMGLGPVRKITEDQWYNFAPRVALRGSEANIPPGLMVPQKTLRGASPEDFFSRKIVTGIDPAEAAAGRFRPVTGPTIPGSPKVPWPQHGPGGARIVPDPLHPEKWVAEGPDLKQIPVQITQTTLPEMVAAGATGGRKFMPGVGESFLAQSEKIQRALQFLKGTLEAVPQFREMGHVLHEHQWAMLPAKEAKKFRQVRVPGLEGQYVKKYLANYFEGSSRNLFDPDTPLGALEELGAKLLDTRLGRLFKDATTWWKRNVLNHPGFYFGNATSDFGLMGSDMHPYLVPFRKAQAAAVQSGYGKPVIEGYTNAQLAKEFEWRGILSAGQLEAEAGNLLSQAYRGPGYVRSAVESEKMPGVLKAAGKPVAGFAEGYGRFNDYMLGKVGGAIEGNSRVGVAINYLKKNVKGIPTAEDLDKAAAHANHVMIDYKKLTPFEQQLRQVVPFATWYKGILGRTAETLLEDPMKLANQGRLLDMALDPMEGRDKRIADEWVKQSAPITGFGGVSFDKMAELMGGEPNPVGPRYGLAGRFIPWTTAQQAISDPIKTLLGSINPNIKAPIELAANYSQYMQRDIDKASGGAPWNVFNPVLNALGVEDTPYSKASRKPFGLSIPSAYDYMLSQSAPGRTAGELSELGRAAGLWEDPYRAEMSLPEAGIWFGSGGKFYPYDRAKFEKKRKYEQKEKALAIKTNLKWALKKGDAEGYEHYRRLLDEQRRQEREMLSFVEGR